MRSLSRVVWSEGMYLGPHHFQAQSRYFEDSTKFATSSLWFAPYGVAGCALDADALQNGTVSILHARGMFRDGLAFEMPDCDPIPAARAVADFFPPTRDTMTVLLGIPDRRPGGQNCTVNGDHYAGTRFVATSRPIHDENTGANERPVSLGRKNMKLLFDTEPAEGLSTLPIARVMRDTTGHFIFDPVFVPPCLAISASESLMLMLRRLIEILGEKSQSMSRSPRSATFAEFSSREIASFWLLHAVNSGLAPLKHLWMSKRGHPEELYLEMSRLAGALCTFALESHPRDIVAYDHDHLDETFRALDHHIRRHLETIVPTNCLSVPLRKTAKYFYEGEITDTRCLQRSRWVLAVKAAAGEVEIINLTPKLVKFCSSAFVPELVKRALPGLPLTHLPVPPPAISAQVDTQYFGITKAGPCWDHLGQTRNVGVYVPGEFPDAELELLVVLES
jgi:type VI secretion system protein ImpJ